MNSQRLRELEMINACRYDSQDIQVYESSLGRVCRANQKSEVEKIVHQIINYKGQN